jgi:hypothetical protein
VVLLAEEEALVDRYLMSKVKAHLLTNVLPGILGLPVSKQSQKFRERVLKEWIATALEEKLEAEHFYSKHGNEVAIRC